MRLVRYQDVGGRPVWGDFRPDGLIHPLTTPPFGAYPVGREVVSADSVRLLAPVEPGKVICVGRNFHAHAAEFDNPPPDEPLLFMKPSTSLIGPDASIIYPSLSERLDPEAELVLVIGRGAHKVQAEDAWSVIGGYTCGNDVTARDIQKSDGQWTRGKGYHTFCPIGPWVETDYDPTDVEIVCTVNGEERQRGRTKDLIFDIPFLIEYISEFTELLPGDIIMTGTPEGVRPVQVGDEVSVEVEGLGRLVNRVVAA
jgi:2-keto-4-pentenoate hydratase/2-oxohepta-3-ene-1,7-dioic acid hydratase in catechol pathway